MEDPRLVQDMTEPELNEYMAALCKAMMEASTRMGVELPWLCLFVLNDPREAQVVYNVDRAYMIDRLQEAVDAFRTGAVAVDNIDLTPEGWDEEEG